MRHRGLRPNTNNERSEHQSVIGILQAGQIRPGRASTDTGVRLQNLARPGPQPVDPGSKLLEQPGS
eukprot:2768290-Alexandrium_andersonii.AAC.1